MGIRMYQPDHMVKKIKEKREKDKRMKEIEKMLKEKK